MVREASQKAEGNEALRYDDWYLEYRCRVARGESLCQVRVTRLAVVAVFAVWVIVARSEVEYSISSEGVLVAARRETLREGPGHNKSMMFTSKLATSAGLVPTNHTSNEMSIVEICVLPIRAHGLELILLSLLAGVHHKAALLDLPVRHLQL